jgi:hypothetical protein
LSYQIRKNEMSRICSTYGERRGAYRVLARIPEESNHFKDPGINGRIILKGIFEKWNEGHGQDRSGSGQGQVAGCCECGNEPPCSTKYGEFLV